MNAFARGNLALVERELRKCVANLKIPVDGVCSLHEVATRVHYACREAERALEELQRAIELEKMTEAAK